MAITYIPLFSINLSHAYYSDGICRDLIVKPTPACADVMKRLGLLFRQIKTGFSVFCRVGDDKQELYQAFDVRKKLSFYLYSRNPYLVNISALPWDMEGGKILYFHNVQTDDGSSDENPKLFVAAEHAGKQDLIESRAQQFSFEYRLATDADATSVLVEIFDAIKLLSDAASVPVQSMLISIPAGEQELSVPVDLTAQPEGAFVIKVDGQEQMRFYADKGLFREKAFAIIDLFASVDAVERYRFTDVTGALLTEKTAVFDVEFKQRKMKWRYHIVMKHQNIALDDLNIALGSDATIFDKQSGEPITDVMSDTTYPVTSFLSRSALDFKEQPEKGMRLSKGSEILIQNLPGPMISSPLKAETDHAGNYILDSENNQLLYSETFVYI